MQIGYRSAVDLDNFLYFEKDCVNIHKFYYVDIAQVENRSKYLYIYIFIYIYI